MKTLKLLPLLILTTMLLTACSAIQPLGYCAGTGLFYYRVGGGPVRSATPTQVQAQGFDPYAYGNWCPGGAPTPTNTAEPSTATPTDTAEPPSPTPTNTSEPPTLTNTEEPAVTATLEPTATASALAPTATNEPRERKPRVVIRKMWLLTSERSWSDGVTTYTGPAWCVVLSDAHPSVERQQALCGDGWNTRPHIVEAICAGSVYDNDLWSCDDDSLRWRIQRWPDKPWLHGLGRDTLDVLCKNHPDYCQ